MTVNKIFMTFIKLYQPAIKTGRGFTLIELLVVIAIISLLASVILVSLNSARAKARDAKRDADLKQVSTALEFYYDKYGRYPDRSIIGGLDCSGFTGDAASGNTFLSLLVSEGFLSKYVADPKGGDCKYQYRSQKDNSSGAQAYRLLFQYETRPIYSASCISAANWNCIRVNYDYLVDGN